MLKDVIELRSRGWQERNMKKKLAMKVRKIDSYEQQFNTGNSYGYH